jgi:hypothetical protein
MTLVEHHFYRQHSHKSAKQKGLNLEQYIKINQERITRRRVVFHSIRFNLNKDILEKIQHAQETGDHLCLSRELLADLRYYALIDPENHFQSGLTFYTYYWRGDSEESLMRSVILTDGEIFHQIQSDCLERPNFCRKITAAHYWLIEQILSQLRLHIFVRLSLLSWGLSLLIVVVVMPFLLMLIPVNFLILLVTVVVLWLLQLVIKGLLYLFFPTISRWAVRQVLSGLLSHKLRPKKIAQEILTWLCA